MTDCPTCGSPIASDDPRASCTRCSVGPAAFPGTVLIQPPESAAAAPSPEQVTLTRAPRAAGEPAPAQRPRGVPGRFRDYEIMDEIARGGMGVVYRARQPALGRTVALKMLLDRELASEEDLIRFRAEAEAAAGLDHPNIIPIHEVGEHEGRWFFSMKLVEGGTLAGRLRSGIPLPLREAAELMSTIARAIQFAHRRGILHRDLKPANILLDGDGHPYLTDFGLAKKVGGDARLTVSGTILGTPAYMPPEQVRAEKNVTTAADVYGLGAILYEMITGLPPFLASNPHEIMRMVLDRDPVRPRIHNARIDSDLETICLKCLEKEPERRYASAEDLASDLDRWLAGESIRARPLSGPQQAVRWARRRPAQAALVAVVLGSATLLVAAGAIFAVRTERARQALAMAHGQLQLALTHQVAGRIDGDLRRLAAVPETIAHAVAGRSDWSETHLREILLGALTQEPRLFGVCAAFEPFQVDPARDLFALYACRKETPPVARQLLPPGYRLYREWEWYRLPIERKASVWSEPFVDTGGGDIPMVTYSVPLKRADRTVGVVTADLSLAYFDELRRWLDELSLGEGAYGFVVSADGAFICHPKAEFRMPRRLQDAAATEGWPAILAGVNSGKPGSLPALDFAGGAPVTVHFAPVRTAGWTLLTLCPRTP